MNENVIIAIVAAGSAVVGGLVSGVITPFIKHRLEQGVTEKNRKRDLITKWRKTLLEVDQAAEGNISPNEILQVHPDYITLEPYLTEEARRTATSENRVIVVGQALSVPLETLKDEIARVEKLWQLEK